MSELGIGMNNHQTQRPIARLPMLIGGLACACLLGAAVGFFTTGLLGHAEGASVSASQSATFGVVPIALGCLMSVLILTPASMRTTAKLGVGVMVASVARLLVGVSGGLIIFLVLKPDPAAFFGALLTSGLLALIVESAWATLSLKSAQSAGAGTA